MESSELDKVKGEIKAIKNVLNFWAAEIRALERNLPVPVLDLDSKFLLYDDLSQEELIKHMDKLQEKENLLLRGNFWQFFSFTHLFLFLYGRDNLIGLQGSIFKNVADWLKADGGEFRPNVHGSTIRPAVRHLSLRSWKLAFWNR
jgi:hypothetical protein